MEDPQTWQELLQNVISDPAELQRIAREIGINPVTVGRWANRISIPRPGNLRSLLEAMPQHRQKMQILLQRDFPNFSPESAAEEPAILEIPSAFYSSIINIYTTSPPILRPSTICIAIFQQMLRHLDPLKQGLLIVACQCVPPHKEEKVRSLRITLGRATSPWENHIDNYTAFMGLESQVGDVVSRGHPIVIPSQKEYMQSYPTHTLSFAESRAVFPLLYFDRIAGAIAVVSTQQNHFTSAHIELLQSYAELLILAFEPEQFYPLKEINLGIMPSSEIQETYTGSFQSEVTNFMREAEKNHQQMKRSCAERIMWKKLEEKLLHLRSF
jgi:hypothetical protein